jgi:hypothetical protein
MNFLKKYINETTGEWVKSTREVIEIFRDYEKILLKRDLEVVRPPTRELEFYRLGKLYFDYLRFHPQFDTTLNPDSNWTSARLADVLDDLGYIKVMKLETEAKGTELIFVWLRRFRKDELARVIEEYFTKYPDKVRT